MTAPKVGGAKPAAAEKLAAAEKPAADVWDEIIAVIKARDELDKGAK